MTPKLKSWPQEWVYNLGCPVILCIYITAALVGYITEAFLSLVGFFSLEVEKQYSLCGQDTEMMSK
jgi:hypothetical protein